jgi:hypothetical protein
VRLPDTEEMWNTSNASMWDEARRSHKASEDVPVPFAAILSNLIRQGRLQERVSEFGKWILAHSLYRYVCESTPDLISQGLLQAMRYGEHAEYTAGIY